MIIKWKLTYASRLLWVKQKKKVYFSSSLSFLLSFLSILCDLWSVQSSSNSYGLLSLRHFKLEKESRVYLFKILLRWKFIKEKIIIIPQSLTHSSFSLSIYFIIIIRNRFIWKGREKFQLSSPRFLFLPCCSVVNCHFLFLKAVFIDYHYFLLTQKKERGEEMEEEMGREEF